MSYKDWMEAFNYDNSDSYYLSDLSKMMSNEYQFNILLRSIKDKGLLTESMKKDVINIMIVKFLNDFRMCSEEQYRKFLPNFNKNVDLSEKNRNGLLDFHSKKSKDGIIGILDTTLKETYVKRTSNSYKQIKDSCRNFNDFAALVSDAEYLKDINIDDLFPTKDLNINNISFKANIEDYYNSIGMLFKGDKQSYENYKEKAKNDLEQVLILTTLNKKNLEITSTNAKYYLKTLLDGDYIEILLLNMNKISSLITDKDILGFQNKILNKYPNWKKNGFNLNEINDLLSRIGVEPENFSKVDKTIEVKEMEAMVLIIDAHELVQNFFNIRKQKVNIVDVTDILDRFFNEKKSLDKNNLSDGSIFENNVFNLITSVSRVNWNLEKDYRILLNILYPENYPLAKEEVKKIIKDELNLFFQNKPGLTREIAEEMSFTMIEKKVMKEDIENVSKSKNKKIVKF